jgi:hypothetical protein
MAVKTIKSSVAEAGKIVKAMGLIDKAAHLTVDGFCRGIRLPFSDGGDPEGVKDLVFPMNDHVDL